MDDTNKMDAVTGSDDDADVDVFDMPDGERAPESDPRWAVLPQSAVLSVEAADDFLCWRDATVVAIVGSGTVGKPRWSLSCTAVFCGVALPKRCSAIA